MSLIRSNLGILLLAVAVLGWFAVVRPQLSSFSTNSLSVKAKSAELDSINARIDSLKEIQAKGADTNRLVTSMYLAMPKSSQVPEVLVMIENLGSNSGIVFTGVSVGTVGNTTTVSEVPVSVSFSGDQTSVTNFLTALNKNIRAVIIHNQTLSSDKSGNLTVTMQLGLVYQGGK